MRRERAKSSGGGRGGGTTTLRAVLNRVKMSRGKRDRGDKFITTVTAIMAGNKTAGLENSLGAAGFNTTTTNTTVPSGWFYTPSSSSPHCFHPLIFLSALLFIITTYQYLFYLTPPSLLLSPLLSVPVL